MKSLYESLLTGNVRKPSAKVQPGSKKELVQIIDEYIEEIKSRPGQEVDLNWIDISHVDDLSEVFEKTNYIPVIDKWKIDHVKTFNSMFEGNEYIKVSPIPVLQKKLLSAKCYNCMFGKCTSLKVAPELPAKVLTENCYGGMFYDCTSLKVAPQLPAKELTEGCYWSMFNGCSSLEVAPELPATSLRQDCYRCMFCHCTSLKKKAKLSPDVVLNDYKAYGMYHHCPCKNK